MLLRQLPCVDLPRVEAYHRLNRRYDELNGESWLVFWLASDLPVNDFRIFARRFVFDSADE